MSRTWSVAEAISFDVLTQLGYDMRTIECVIKRPRRFINAQKESYEFGAHDDLILPEQTIEMGDGSRLQVPSITFGQIKSTVTQFLARRQDDSEEIENDIYEYIMSEDAAALVARAVLESVHGENQDRTEDQQRTLDNAADDDRDGDRTPRPASIPESQYRVGDCPGGIYSNMAHGSIATSAEDEDSLPVLSRAASSEPPESVLSPRPGTARSIRHPDRGRSTSRRCESRAPSRSRSMRDVDRGRSASRRQSLREPSLARSTRRIDRGRSVSRREPRRPSRSRSRPAARAGPPNFKRKHDLWQPDANARNNKKRQTLDDDWPSLPLEEIPRFTRANLTIPQWAQMDQILSTEDRTEAQKSETMSLVELYLSKVFNKSFQRIEIIDMLLYHAEHSTGCKEDSLNLFQRYIRLFTGSRNSKDVTNWLMDLEKRSRAELRLWQRYVMMN